ncbi:MAG: hypothetical protein J0H43_09955, partial [Actinobacteria bacterium]|nr:hypothetical protein [Actinomycetota bacterium]
ETGDRVAEAEVLVGSGRQLLVSARTGRADALAAALDIATRAAETARTAGGLGVEAVALDLLAAARLVDGDLDGAEASAGDALERHLASGARLGAARARVVLGHVRRARGQDEAADHEWREAFGTFAEAGVPEAEEVRGLLAGPALDTGRDHPQRTSVA